jgi:hypothetical protein
MKGHLVRVFCVVNLCHRTANALLPDRAPLSVIEIEGARSKIENAKKDWRVCFNCELFV